MTYVFDLDNTLCKTMDGNYINSTPMVDRIQFVNELYSNGNEIIIYTARGMGSAGNNSHKAIQKYYSFTEKQLKTWNLKYHFLFLGKPSGDFYIDDKGVESENFFRSNLRS